MFLAKLKLAVDAVMVVPALGAGGVAYQVSGPRPAQAAPESKPQSELESLMEENELLKLNLHVVLEKVRALEAEPRATKAREEVTGKMREADAQREKAYIEILTYYRQVEAALRAFREARDPEAKRRAADR
jgi:hypothetical protein